MKLRVLFLVLAFALVSALNAQTVIQRVRLGNTVEGITFINNGPYAKHIAIIDGQNLYAVPAEGRGNTPFKKLFNFTTVGFSIAPRGLAWIESEKLFIFTDATIGGLSTTFRFSDHHGRPKGSIVFNWPDDFVDAAPYVEGIVWMPPDAPRYAGNFIFIARPTASDSPTLFVMDRAGQYVDRIPFNTYSEMPDYTIDPIGLAYRSGHLLLGDISGNLWEIDLDSNFVRPPVFFNDATDIEGVAVLATGRVAITSHCNGKLIYLDGNLNRLPEQRSYLAGFGLSTASTVAWDNTNNRFGVYFNDLEPTAGLPQLAAISPDLKSTQLILDMAPNAGNFYGRMDYLPSGVWAMPRRAPRPRKIQFFNELGTSDGPLIGNDGMQPQDNLVAFSFIPDAWLFAVRRATTPTTLEFIDYLGAPIGTPYNLAPAMPPGAVIVDIAYFAPDGTFPGKFLVLTSGSPQTLLLVDYSGNVLATYNTSRLATNSLSSVKYISTGPKRGDFVAVDNNEDELIIFKLP